MWLVHDFFPAAAPLEAEGLAKGAKLVVERMIVEVGFAFEDADVEGYAEIVIAKSSSCVGDDAAWRGAALRVDGVLLCVGPEGADDADIQAARLSEVLGRADECGDTLLDVGMERGKVALAAVVEGHFFLRAGAFFGAIFFARGLRSGLGAGSGVATGIGSIRRKKSKMCMIILKI